MGIWKRLTTYLGNLGQKAKMLSRSLQPPLTDTLTPIPVPVTRNP
jgi:hypothetical protein